MAHREISAEAIGHFFSLDVTESTYVARGVRAEAIG